jgi:hypothetical protein
VRKPKKHRFNGEPFRSYNTRRWMLELRFMRTDDPGLTVLIVPSSVKLIGITQMTLSRRQLVITGSGIAKVSEQIAIVKTNFIFSNRKCLQSDRSVGLLRHSFFVSGFRNSSVKCPRFFSLANFSALNNSEPPFGMDRDCQLASASIFPIKTICPT